MRLVWLFLILLSAPLQANDVMEQAKLGRLLGGCFPQRELPPESLVRVVNQYSKSGSVRQDKEPDWVLDMATGTVSRRLLRRPEIRLRIVRAERRAWKLFARHHYLSGNLARGCRCYLALWNDEPVAFCATIGMLGFKGRWRVSRIVTLPDYQGVGIGGAFLETLGDIYRTNKDRFSITASHQSILEHCRRSPKWKTTNVMKTGSKGGKHKTSAGRAVISFEYTG